MQHFCPGNRMVIAAFNPEIVDFNDVAFCQSALSQPAFNAGAEAVFLMM